MIRSLVAILGLLLPGPAFAQMAHSPPVAAPAPPGLDRAGVRRDAEAHLTALIARDTRNPPGNEALTAKYLDSVLSAVSGIETRILDEGNGRANFVARLRAANPGKRPILVMGHMDTVGADPSKWQTPPLEPSVRDGYLYGRGAIDDKGMLAAAVAALQQLAPRRNSLTRDIILVATAAEEGGGDVGVERMVSTHFDLIKDAEFALNEGGRVRMRDGRVETVNIQVTEKISYNVVGTAGGTGGHGSVPLPGNALAALARAVSRVHEWKVPARMNEITRIYFSKLATIERDPAKKRAMEEVATSTNEGTIAAAADVLSREPLHNAVLRTGLSLTLIDGGIRTNIIPSEGTATFNIRVLPGDDIQSLVKEMNRVGGEPQVMFEFKGPTLVPPPVSPITSELFKAMESTARLMAPDAVVLPFMSTGGTDGKALRKKGIPTYGILPMPLEEEDELRMHGDNERVSLGSLGWAAEYLYSVLLSICANT